MMDKITKWLWVTALSFSMIVPVHQALGQSSDVARIATYRGDDRERRLVEGATKEGVLTIYSAVAVDDNAAIVDAFQKRYGIKVNVWRSSSEGSGIECSPKAKLIVTWWI